ncbi:probable calcium-binding protein CML35 [Rhododendron vialii]|uniref:probable calcium-binding protein CML35 n=1 Tax=Rhododendron vialii TaxID=182163 RepID=UPI00265F6636|nr:probable calcium-binding protein CML35 [Rhododendron vialii]
MKLVININPKKLFRSKKSRSISGSDPPSFGSGSTSSDSSESSSSHHHNHKSDGGKRTPTSVLTSTDIHFELVQALKMTDKEGNGKITRKQLEAVLSRVGGEPPSEEELTKMLDEVDRDGNGSISFEEFGAISSAFGPPACDTELRDAFEFFDTNRDGRITAEELHAVFSAIGDGRCTLEDCRRMISGVDKNGDGFVCFEDFSLMMEQQQQR